MTTKRTCTIDGCAGLLHARNMCNVHYRRFMKPGDPHCNRSIVAERANWLIDMVRTGDRSVCWEWPFSKYATGYGSVSYKGRTVLTHRLACELDGRPIGDGLVTRHLCNNPPCCNPAHLKEGTQSENLADMIWSGRSTRGTKNTQAKLTAQQVLEIVDRCNVGATQASVAEVYGICRPNVSAIMSGYTWAWLTGIKR